MNPLEHEHERHNNMARTRLAVCLAFAALAVGFTFMAGYAARKPTAPAVVAFVDLEKVFNSLDSRIESEKNIRKMAVDMEDETTSMREELELLQAELESLEPGTDAMAELNDRAVSVAGRLRAFQKYSALLLEREQANDLRVTYDMIRAAAAEYSKASKIDIVLLNDSIPTINPSDSANTLQQISARRILYANDVLDITEDLIAKMNAAGAG
ncbi:MAG: OmpH family outer membrane protein [Phycisphaerales bacterium]|jgi:Skp family chaperone for outer membrane proteins|nr:OmpH family outer membrane protein [Phycisphaerales bacterium]